MKFIASAATAAALSLASLPTAAIAQNVVSMPQDSSFNDVNLRMSAPFSGGYEGRAALKNVGGKLALCGVGIVTNAQVSSTVNTALRGGTVKINGKTVLKNFRFFAKAKRRNQVKTANVNCKIIEGPLPKRSDKVEVNFGRATFRN